MTSNQSPIALKKFWRGYIAGTNRGSGLLKLTQSGDTLSAKVILLDHQLGPATMWFKGTLAGTKLELRMIRSKSNAPLRPLDGKVTANLDDKSQIIEGTWETDIGTSGVCRFESANANILHWIGSITGAKFRALAFRWLAFFYLLFLVGCAIVSMTGHTQLSWSVAVLLLVPAPFLFARDLAGLIAAFKQAGLKKAGPFEFEQSPPTAELLAIATQHAQENVAFAHLNQFFVLRTKILLAVLAHSDGMPLAEFGHLARSFGVAEDNVSTTLQAILQMGCAQVDGDRVIPTPWGRRYVHAGLRLA